MMRVLRILALCALALAIGVLGWLAQRAPRGVTPGTVAERTSLAPTPAAAPARAPTPASGREERAGTETTAQREEREQRRAAWEARLAAYRAARDAILADASRDPQTRDAAIEDLLARNFDARERIRIRAIDLPAQPAEP